LLTFSLPVVLYLKRWGMLALTHPWMAPGTALCIVIVMYMCDMLFNSQPNPIYVLCAGALMGMERDERVIAMMRAIPQQPPQAAPPIVRVEPMPGLASAGAQSGAPQV
jgi:hypothetical protein